MNNYKDYYLSDTYVEHMYTGLIGKLMHHCHLKMENSNIKRSNILEVGAGIKPHIDYIKHDFEKYHIVDIYEELSDFYNKYEKIIYKVYDGTNLPYDNEYFDRIIISHCLEHVSNPENFLFEMISKLKKNGVLTISLPTDPGILWRLGRVFGNMFINKKTHKLSVLENNYMNAKEHINPIFNLRTIIRHNFLQSLTERYEPFKIQSLDLNFFYIAFITKN